MRSLSPLITLLIILPSIFQTAKAQCTSTNLTVFLRTREHIGSFSTGQPLTGLNIDQCASVCAANNCATFVHNEVQNSCLVTAESVQPFGATRVQPSNNADESMYQKICIASDRVCRSHYAFERVPQTVLAGMAKEVSLTSGLSECLQICLESAGRFGFDCLSVMFFYDTHECMLNNEHRRTRPELFTDDTAGFIVDYFENECTGSECYGDQQPLFMKVENEAMNQGYGVPVQSVTMQKCRQMCMLNAVENGAGIACKSYSYDQVSSECLLSTNRVYPLGYLELHNMLGTHYYEKVCLRPTTTCLNEYPFIRVRQQVLTGHADQLVHSPNIAHCLDSCLIAECGSAMYNHDLQQCILNTHTRFTRPTLFSKDTKGFYIDYFDNTCQYSQHTVLQSGNTLIASTQPSTVNRGAIATECHESDVRVKIRFNQATSGSVFVRHEHDTCAESFTNQTEVTLIIPLVPPEFTGLPIANSQLVGQRVCTGEQLARGVVSYMVVVQKNRFGVPGLVTGTDRLFNVTCDYEGSLRSRQLDTRHNQNLDGQTVILDGSTSVSGRGDSDEATNLPEVKMLLMREKRSVTHVLLGEKLNLKWVVKNPDKIRGKIGYFIKSCKAERTGGNPPQPTPVLLITDGCPDASVRNRLLSEPIRANDDGSFETSMTVFRFDGSRSVRIRCVVDWCYERCNPVNCTLNSQKGPVDSMGRKKRQSDGGGSYSPSDIEYLRKLAAQFNAAGKSAEPVIPTNLNELNPKPDYLDISRGIIRNEEIQGSFTIVDKLREESDRDILSAYLDQDTGATELLSDLSSPLYNRVDGKLCMVRPLFVSSFTILSILTFVQVSTIFAYLRCNSAPGDIVGRARSDTSTESNGTLMAKVKRLRHSIYHDSISSGQYWRTKIDAKFSALKDRVITYGHNMNSPSTHNRGDHPNRGAHAGDSRHHRPRAHSQSTLRRDTTSDESIYGASTDSTCGRSDVRHSIDSCGNTLNRSQHHPTHLKPSSTGNHNFIMRSPPKSVATSSDNTQYLARPQLNQPIGNPHLQRANHLRRVYASSQSALSSDHHHHNQSDSNPTNYRAPSIQSRVRPLPDVPGPDTKEPRKLLTTQQHQTNINRIGHINAPICNDRSGRFKYCSATELRSRNNGLISNKQMIDEANLTADSQQLSSLI